MDSNLLAAARLSSGSKGRYQPPSFLSRSGIKWDGGFEAEMLMGFEEMDMHDDIREEHPCPFCSKYYDIVGLCCHIDDEHHVEAKNGVNVCPVCAARVGADIVAHIALQHGNIFKMHHPKRKSRKAGSHKTSLSLLRRELREGQSMFGGSTASFSSSNIAPDPLLSSFILPMCEDNGSAHSHSLSESTLTKKSTSDSISEREVEKPPMSIKDQEEKANRSEFVQGLLLSMMFDDDDDDIV